MKSIIKSRDIKFFALGILVAFIFATIYDWEENKKAFEKGWSKRTHVFHNTDYNE